LYTFSILYNLIKFSALLTMLQAKDSSLLKK
jgi:hypothetical protein